MLIPNLERKNIAKAKRATPMIKKGNISLNDFALRQAAASIILSSLLLENKNCNVM